jgi:hypothetical protein
MKKNNVRKACTEKQRKALVSFLCDNAETAIADIIISDDYIARIQSVHDRVEKASYEMLQAYENQLFTLMLGEIDGIKMAELARNLLQFTREQLRGSKIYEERLFKGYETVSRSLGALMFLMSKNGVDTDYLDSLCDEEAPKKPEKQED